MRSQCNKGNWGVLLLAIIYLFCPGCSSFRYIFPDDDLQSIINERVGPEKAPEIIIPFEANAEMKEFARRITIQSRNTRARVQRIVDGILQKSQLNVKYQKSLTTTAKEVFYSGQGNCLAYTNLFVTLARSIGLRAMFVDASLLINDVEEQGGMIINNGHICAAIYAEPELLFIDFTERVSRKLVGYKFIDDLEAMAHYYNNIAYEKRFQAQTEGDYSSLAGIEEFHIAIQLSPEFYRAYNNVGVAYQQVGEYDKAIEYYQKAIDIYPEFASPHSNLGMLYFRLNDMSKARKYLLLAIKINSQNPFNFYYLGLIEYKSGNLKEAQKHLEKAIRLKKDFALAHQTLSQVHRRQGFEQKADEEMKKAQGKH